jgi:hypothetical protein
MDGHFFTCENIDGFVPEGLEAESIRLNHIMVLFKDDGRYTNSIYFVTHWGVWSYRWT